LCVSPFLTIERVAPFFWEADAFRKLVAQNFEGVAVED
jgi:hypothetical protein